MKTNIFFSTVIAFAIGLISCEDRSFEDPVVNQAPKVPTFQEELAIVNNYTRIDTINNLYSVVITDSIVEAENLFESDISLIVGNIAKLNNEIEQSVKSGDVTTLVLYNNKGFESYTVNKPDNLLIKDTFTYGIKAATRGSNLGSISFMDGNWYKSSISFNASDHVTSKLSVSNCRGYWQVSVTCNTGTSSYGQKFTTYGTSYTSGSINRYWWYTGGGSAPFKWTFTTNGPVGGEASGNIDFSNTY